MTSAGSAKSSHLSAMPAAAAIATEMDGEIGRAASRVEPDDAVDDRAFVDDAPDRRELIAERSDRQRPLDAEKPERHGGSDDDAEDYERTRVRIGCQHRGDHERNGRRRMATTPVPIPTATAAVIGNPAGAST